VNLSRVYKVIISASLAIFAFLVGLSNILDSELIFVQHVLSMDTVFPDNPLKSRAILDPFIWQLAMAAIIFAELLMGVLLTIGVIGFIRGFNNAVAFTRAKSWVYLGCSVGLLLFFLGFIVIGGEWFCMWQSTQFNGVEPAFRFVVLIMLSLVLISLPETDIGVERI
jgi:predicted small integral membrane protein